MKGNTAIVFFGAFLTISYICAALQGIDGQLFTLFTNALLLLGTGKIIWNQKKRIGLTWGDKE